MRMGGPSPPSRRVFTPTETTPTALSLCSARREHLPSHGTCPIRGGSHEGGQHLHRGGGVGVCSKPLLHLPSETLGHLLEGLLGEPHVVEVLVDLKGGNKAKKSAGGLGTQAQPSQRCVQDNVRLPSHLLGLMQEAGASCDPPRRAENGCASTLPTRHRQQCRNSLSPGMPITPAAVLAPLPEHPGPLSKELTKCQPAPSSAVSPCADGCRLVNAEPQGAPDAPRHLLRSFTYGHPNRL